MRAGEIYKHARFYADPESGALLPKYFLVLALTNGRDVVLRLLTSRQHGRPEVPPCFHGYPYPGFYLGVPGGELGTKSWLDLRWRGDYDGDDFQQGVQKGDITLSVTLPQPTLCGALDCASRADDTTDAQRRIMLDTLAALR